MKRRIDLSVLLGITVSKQTDEIVIHAEGGSEAEYDYYYVYAKKRKIIENIARPYKSCAGRNLILVEFDSKSLKNVVTTKKEKKKDAKEKWDRLAQKVQQKILDTLPDFLKGKDVKFVPMPISYFNAQRWDDELGVVSTEIQRPNPNNVPDTKEGWLQYEKELSAYEKQVNDDFVSRL